MLSSVNIVAERIGLKATVEPSHLAGNATIRPRDEKPVPTKPPPPDLAVSRA